VCLENAPVIAGCKGSFDFARASLREPLALLRMRMFLLAVLRHGAHVGGLAFRCCNNFFPSDKSGL
jgi:hypothetical protein